MKKYLAYYRKSTDTEDKQVLSLDDQKRIVRDYAKHNNLHIATEEKESFSAKKLGRPIFNKVIELLKSNKYNGVIAYKADRLTRNYHDLGLLTDLIESDIEVWATDYGCYKNTANDKTMIGLNTVMAKRKIDDLSEDTKRGMEGRAQNGWWPGWAPLGYLNIDIQGRISGKQYNSDKQKALEALGRELHPIEVDPFIGPIIKRGFELYYYEDYSVNSLALKLTKEGLLSRTGKVITKSALHAVLSNPFYYGVMKYKGEFQKANHQRLIDKNTFLAIQDKLAGKTHPNNRSQKLDFTYKGIMFCGECGCAITAESRKKVQKNGNVHKYVYYHCTKSKGNCSQPHIEEKPLEKQLSELFANFFVTESQVNEISKKLGELFLEDIEYQENQEMQLKTRLTKLSTEKKNLFRKMISGEIEDKEMYTELKNDIEGELYTIQEKLDNIKQHSTNWLEQSSNLLYLAQHAQELFLEGTKEEKQTLINCVASNLFLRDKNVEFELKKPFVYLSEIDSGQTLLPR